MPKTFASIDIGTNTFRLLISDISSDGLNKKVLKREITRLGGGFTSDCLLAEESMGRGLSTLSSFSKLIKSSHVEQIRAVATSVVREARNGPEFVKRVKKITGIDIEVIDGREEALLSLKGVLSCVKLKTSDALVFDIGGGSTEYILANRSKPAYAESIRLGVVHSTETFLISDPTTDKEINEASDFVEKRLHPFIDNLSKKGLTNKLPPGNQDITLIGTAGTITTLAAMAQGLRKYDPARINNYLLRYDTVKELFNLIYPISLSERKKLLALETGREDIIVAGTIIAMKTMEMLRFDRMLVSDGGLLEGVMIDMAGKNPLNP